MRVMADVPDIVPVNVAAERLSVSKGAIRLWYTQGRIKKYRKPLDKNIYVSVSEIEALRNAPPKPVEGD